MYSIYLEGEMSSLSSGELAAILNSVHINIAGTGHMYSHLLRFSKEDNTVAVMCHILLV